MLNVLIISDCAAVEALVAVSTDSSLSAQSFSLISMPVVSSVAPVIVQDLAISVSRVSSLLLI